MARRFICGPSNPYDPDARVTINDVSISISGWPSRGGVIVLEDRQSFDLEFLGLNPLDPPKSRDATREVEHTFCRRLLLLGAKWWDSEERQFYVKERKDATAGYLNATSHGGRIFQKGDTSSGGWKSGGHRLEGCGSPNSVRPGVVLMRKTTCRRMVFLELTWHGTWTDGAKSWKTDLEGKFFASLSDYEGYAFLRAWEWKWTGEVGRKLLTPEETTEEWIANLR